MSATPPTEAGQHSAHVQPMPRVVHQVIKVDQSSQVSLTRALAGKVISVVAVTRVALDKVALIRTASGVVVDGFLALAVLVWTATLRAKQSVPQAFTDQAERNREAAMLQRRRQVGEAEKVLSRNPVWRDRSERKISRVTKLVRKKTGGGHRSIWRNIEHLFTGSKK